MPQKGRKQISKKSKREESKSKRQKVSEEVLSEASTVKVIYEDKCEEEHIGPATLSIPNPVTLCKSAQKHKDVEREQHLPKLVYDQFLDRIGELYTAESQADDIEDLEFELVLGMNLLQPVYRDKIIDLITIYNEDNSSGQICADGDKPMEESINIFENLRHFNSNSEQVSIRFYFRTCMISSTPLLTRRHRRES